VVEADAGNDAVRAGGKAGQDETRIAPRGVGGDAPGLQQHSRPAAAGELTRDRQTCKPAADDADLGVDFGAKRRPRRRIDYGRRVPSVAIGRCGIGCVHRSASSARSKRRAAQSYTTLRVQAWREVSVGRSHYRNFNTAALDRDPFQLNRITVQIACSRLIFSENRSPLFGMML
jgi:hypothetical protein